MKKLLLLFLTIHLSYEATPNFAPNSCRELDYYPVRELYPEECYYNPNIGKTVPEILTNIRLSCQTHQVATRDGYILEMHRILDSRGHPRYGPPVFLLHGIATDAQFWLDSLSNSLSLNLYDQGYDVWMGNTRGTRYSRQHVTMDDTDPEFWEYTLDNMKFDVEAFLERVHNETGKKSFFVGHSLGTTQFFIFASEAPKTAEKFLNGAALLSPIFHLDMVIQLEVLAAVVEYTAPKLLASNIKVVFYHIKYFVEIIQSICGLLPHTCVSIIQLIAGVSNQFLPEHLFHVVQLNSLTNSVRALHHVTQMVHQRTLKKYDFDPEKNLELYGEESPPEYDLSRISLDNITLYWSNEDNFITKSSAEKIYKQLKVRTKALKQVPINGMNKWRKFNHVDYQFARDLWQSFYPDLFDMLYKVCH